MCFQHFSTMVLLPPLLVFPMPPGRAGIHHVQVAAGAQLVDDAAAAVEVTDDVSHVLL